MTGCDDTTAPEKEPASQAPQPRGTPVTQFERGRLSMPSAYGERGRAFSATSPEDAAAIDAALKALANVRTLAEAEAIITSVRHIESAELLRLAQQLSSHQDPDVRLTALTLVEGFSDPNILPLIQKASTDSSADVRVEAMEVAQPIVHPRLQPILISSLKDSHPTVRQLAIFSALKQKPDVQRSVLDDAAKSPHADVAQSALSFTEASPSKTTVGRYFNALDHPDATVRIQAQEALALTFHQTFKTGAEASNWWAKHQQSFDDNLVLTDRELATKMARGQ
jgi:HEAT repeat protein